MRISIILASLMAAVAALSFGGGAQASLEEPNQQPVIANDLQGTPTAADHLQQDVYHFVDQNNQRYAIPAAISRVRAKQRPTEATRTVINGNHATYVEPPADFKPIIYEPEKQPVAASAANDLQGFDSSPAAAGTSSQETSQQQQQQQVASSVSVNGLSRQQHQQHQYQLAINQNNQQQQQAQQRPPLPLPAPQSPQSDAESPGGDELQADKISLDGSDQDPSSSSSSSSVSSAASTPFKAPIGRWSDWHDMSVEPDLASSDSDSSQATYYFAAPAHKFPSPSPLGQRVERRRQASLSNLHTPTTGEDVEPSTNYRTRYGSIKGAFVAPAWQPQVTYNPVFYPPGQLIKGHQHHHNHLLHHHHLQQQQQQQQQSLASQRASQFEQRPAIKGEIDEQQQPHLQAQHRALDLNSQQPAALSSYSSSSASASSSPSSSSSSLSSSSSSLAATPMMLMPFNSNSHDEHRRQLEIQNRLAGAGGLIKMQLVAENKAPLSVPRLISSSVPPPKLVKELKTKSEQSGVTSGQQQQQPPVAAQGRRLKRRRKSKTNVEVRIQQFAHPESSQAGHSDTRPLISATEQPKQVNGPATSMPANGSPVARLLASPGEQRVPQAQRVPTSKPVQARKPTGQVMKRAVQKKRPIRTLQPVGLTSWFLGGIRDLDGRHWHLPADVISKLAVNDVDLHHEQPHSATSPEQAPAQTQQVNEVEKATVSSSSSTTTLKPNAIPR